MEERSIKPRAPVDKPPPPDFPPESKETKKAGSRTYVVRSGDNMTSIANYFGVSLTRVKAMNPWVQSGLTIGRGLRIPPPTR